MNDHRMSHDSHSFIKATENIDGYLATVDFTSRNAQVLLAIPEHYLALGDIVASKAFVTIGALEVYARPSDDQLSLWCERVRSKATMVNGNIRYEGEQLRDVATAQSSYMLIYRVAMIMLALSVQHRLPLELYRARLRYMSKGDITTQSSTISEAVKAHFNWCVQGRKESLLPAPASYPSGGYDSLTFAVTVRQADGMEVELHLQGRNSIASQQVRMTTARLQASVVMDTLLREQAYGRYATQGSQLQQLFMTSDNSHLLDQRRVYPMAVLVPATSTRKMPSGEQYPVSMQILHDVLSYLYSTGQINVTATSEAGLGAEHVWVTPRVPAYDPVMSIDSVTSQVQQMSMLCALAQHAAVQMRLERAAKRTLDDRLVTMLGTAGIIEISLAEAVGAIVHGAVTVISAYDVDGVQGQHVINYESLAHQITEIAYGSYKEEGQADETPTILQEVVIPQLTMCQLFSASHPQGVITTMQAIATEGPTVLSVASTLERSIVTHYVPMDNPRYGSESDYVSIPYFCVDGRPLQPNVMICLRRKCLVTTIALYGASRSAERDALLVVCGSVQNLAGQLQQNLSSQGSRSLLPVPVAYDTLLENQQATALILAFHNDAHEDHPIRFQSVDSGEGSWRQLLQTKNDGTHWWAGQSSSLIYPLFLTVAQGIIQLLQEWNSSMTTIVAKRSAHHRMRSMMRRWQ